MKKLSVKHLAIPKLWIFSSLAIFLIIFRLIFFPAESSIYSFINEMLIIFLLFFLSFYFIEIIKLRKPSAFSLVLNIGILTAFYFFVITFSDSIYGLFFNIEVINNLKPSFLENLSGTLYGILFLAFTAYLLITLREFYYQRQAKNLNIYYNLMIIFIVLASASRVYGESYISKALFVVSIILIAFNSIRISWIAFIIKKEKISILVLSAIIFTLFIINLLNSGLDSLPGQILRKFSAPFQQFFILMMLYGAIYFTVLFFTTLFHIPTAEAFDRKAQEVSSLQYFSKLITEVFDFKELAQTITEITIKVSNADSAWIILNEKDNYSISSNRYIAFVDAEAITKHLYETAKLSQIKETMIYNLSKSDQIKNLSEKYSSIVVSPLRTYSEVKGYLIAARKNELIFYEDDKTAINTFSDYASVAMENSILLEESLEKERLEKEMDVAREIQRKILPSKDPNFPNLEITSVFIPAFEVGGDYYDYFQISDKKYGFVIADVSGKGISAAFIMAEIKGIFESLSRLVHSPREILIKANDILKTTLNTKNFVSALFGVVDAESGKLTMARAGHCPVILLRNGTAEIFKPLGIGLGLTYSDIFQNNLEEFNIDLENNDTLVLFTDGITEAKNERMEDYGDDRFKQLLIKNSKKQLEEMANNVVKEVTIFSSHQSQYDDITLVILRWQKKINHTEYKNGRIQHLDQR